MATAPGQDAFIIFDDTPAHRHTTLPRGTPLNYLPPYSPFFNPFEVFSKFQSSVKAYLNEHSAAVLAQPEATALKEHQWQMLQTAMQEAMQKIQRVDFAAYDSNHFKYIVPALQTNEMQLAYPSVEYMQSIISIFICNENFHAIEYIHLIEVQTF